MVSSNDKRRVLIYTQTLKLSNVCFNNSIRCNGLLVNVLLAWILSALNVTIKSVRWMRAKQVNETERTVLTRIINRESVMLQLLVILEIVFGVWLRGEINFIHIDLAAHAHIEVLRVIPETGLKHPRHVPTQSRLVKNTQCTKNIQLVIKSPTNRWMIVHRVLLSCTSITVVIELVSVQPGLKSSILDIPQILITLCPVINKLVEILARLRTCTKEQ